jgi:hypothetical protein
VGQMSNSMLKLGTPKRKVDKNYDPLFFTEKFFDP